MKALIFAAGLGTRLKPFTEKHPKALYPVCGKPLLYHVIMKLKQSGFNDIVINIHHFGEQIIEYLKQENYFDIPIQISDERNLLLDTGGGIKKAASLLDGTEPFLVHNVDIISNADLTSLYRAHQKNNDALATLLVNERNSSRQLLWNTLNKLAGWMNETTQEIKSPYPEINLQEVKRMAFSGIHIISPTVFQYMKNWPDVFSIIDFYLFVADKTAIYAHTEKELTLVDVGKPENQSKAEELIKCR